ncbi:MAG: hypothetical protein WBK76_01060 [Candidatus Saccharimonadales bacterium]
MQSFFRRQFSTIEWGLGILTVAVSLAVWIPNLNNKDLSVYDVFPVLGLLAFGLMWSHYAVGALRRALGVSSRERKDIYMTTSMSIVLVLLLLHPGLLMVGLFMDGYGLPPFSYLQVYETQIGFVLMGTIALVIFLSYELRRKYRTRIWWRYVEHLQLVGMLLIMIHALGVGGDLQSLWAQILWILYAVTLVLAAGYSLLWDNKQKGNT